jgi:hypothetical protein
LQDGLVVKPHFAQVLVMSAANFRSVFGQLDHIFHHRSFRHSQWRLGIVGLERSNQVFVQRYATQKLCVGLDSIGAPVGYRDHRGNDFVLSPREREFGRHQHTESCKGMVQSSGDKAVRLDDLCATSFRRMDGRGIFHRIERSLGFHRTAQIFIGFSHRDSLDPSHKLLSSLPALLIEGLR